MLKTFARRLSPTLLHFSVLVCLLFGLNTHATDLQKILPPEQLLKIQTHYDSSISARFNAWYKLIQEGKNQPVDTQLNLVNNFFNQMQWTEDEELWLQKDYWATPVESLILNAGDCEDFSIAKYFTLLQLGVPMDLLKVSYVEIKSSGQAHMVLTYYKNSRKSDPLILDNMNTDILPASARSDLKPIFHFNNKNIWREDSISKPFAPARQLERWSDMMDRFSLEQS